MGDVDTLRALHHVPGRPVVLPNVWDAASARVFAEAGFPALATSSSATAAVLGYADGERAPREQVLASIGRVAAAVDVPVTADIETGYGLSPHELVEELLRLGIAGFNVEDSDPRTGRLLEACEQARTIASLRAAAGDRLVINARIDVFLPGRGGSLGEAGPWARPSQGRPPMSRPAPTASTRSWLHRRRSLPCSRRPTHPSTR